MENNLQVFNYNDSAVRTVQKDGEPWFVLKDVCSVLGISKYRDTAERLDPDERQCHQLKPNSRKCQKGREKFSYIAH